MKEHFPTKVKTLLEQEFGNMSSLAPDIYRFAHHNIVFDLCFENDDKHFSLKFCVAHQSTIIPRWVKDLHDPDNNASFMMKERFVQFIKEQTGFDCEQRNYGFDITYHFFALTDDKALVTWFKNVVQQMHEADEKISQVLDN